MDKLGGIGASEIGKLFTEKGLKAKTARTLILEKAKEILTGEKKNVTTPAMLHGIFSEELAYHTVVKECFPSSKLRSSDSILIQDGLWATPDVTDDVEELTMDIKCPFTIASFFKNIRSLPKAYIYQNQQQMMATGHKKGMVCLFLTANRDREDHYGNIIEYDIDVNDRYRLLPLEADESIHSEILIRFDEFKRMRDFQVETLADVTEVGDTEFFDIHKDNKVTRLKDKFNPQAWDESCIIMNNSTYYVTEINN